VRIRVVDVATAARLLDELVDDVDRGVDVRITVAGRVRGRLVPLQEPDEPPATEPS
jgi:antitoxin (DNA-binding transcriptional repressor) of toxin-antitoxin stability system